MIQLHYDDQNSFATIFFMYIYETLKQGLTRGRVTVKLPVGRTIKKFEENNYFSVVR